MIKFKNVGDFKNARNIGTVETPIELINGKLVTLDKVAGAIALPTADTAKGSLWVVMNERESVPYTGTTDDYVINIGECPRLVDVTTLKGVTLEMNDKCLTTKYVDIAEGDALVADTNGNFTKVSDASGYETSFTVIKKTSYGGNGLEVAVNA